MAAIRLVRRTGQIRVDPKAATDALAPAIVKAMRDRITAGVGGDGAKMPSYSPLYRQQLAALGESTAVDINRSGRLLADLQVLRVDVTGPRAVIVFGVGAGTSPRPPRPPPWVFSAKKTPEQQAKALASWKESQKRVEQSLPHPEVLKEHVTGGVGRPARAVLGLTPAQVRELARAVLQKAKIFSYG